MLKINVLRIAFQLTSVFSCIFFISSTAYGFCSDQRHLSVQDEVNSSDVIALALVTAEQKIISPDDPEGIEGINYDIRLYRYFKGIAVPTFKIRSDNTSSRFPMEIGKKYLTFIKIYGSEGVVDPCGNSGEVKDRKSEIYVLKHKQQVQSQQLHQ